MRIVLDTNCLVQVIGIYAKNRWLYDAILNGEIELCVTTDILLEYVEVIDSFFDSKMLGKKTIARFLTLPTIIKQDVYYRWKLIYKDPDDDKFVDCAIAGNADLLISNDAHFKVLQKNPFPKVKKMRLEEFSKAFKTQFR